MVEPRDALVAPDRVIGGSDRRLPPAVPGIRSDRPHWRDPVVAGGAVESGAWTLPRGRPAVARALPPGDFFRTRPGFGAAARKPRRLVDRCRDRGGDLGGGDDRERSFGAP